MKAVFVEQNGGADVLRYSDFAQPVAAAGQALVKVAASGVNFIDAYQRSGLYKLPLPAVLGMEGAGTVEALGEYAVAGFARRRSGGVGHVARQLRRIRGRSRAVPGEGARWPRSAAGRRGHAAGHDGAVFDPLHLPHRVRPYGISARRRGRQPGA